MFKTLSIKTRLVFVIAFLAAELVAGAAIGIYNLGAANAELKSLHDNRVVPAGQLSRVMQLVTTNQLLVGKAADASDSAQRDAYLTQVDANVVEASATWKTYAQTRMTGEEAALAAKFVEARQAFLAQGLQPAVAAVRAGDSALANELVAGEMARRFQPVGELGGQLLALQQHVAQADYQRSQQTYETVRLVCLAGLAFGLVLAAVVGLSLIHI